MHYGEHLIAKMSLSELLVIASAMAEVEHPIEAAPEADQAAQEAPTARPAR
jgi:hypothetical protein